MSDHDAGELRELLGDAVADIEPGDRLGEIRRRTARTARQRRWPLVVLAGTATAAVVTGVTVLGDLGGGREGDPVATAPARQTTVAAYYSQVVPGTPHLFREFRTVTAADDRSRVVLESLRLLERGTGAQDPDYATAWPDGSFLDVAVEDDVIRIEVSDEAQQEPEVPLSATVVALPAVQQAVYTAQAAVGALLPVSFESGGTPVARILWTLVVSPVQRDPSLAAPVNISDPAEGHQVDDKLTVRGVVAPGADSATTVRWRLRAPDGSVVVSVEAPVVGTSWEQTVGIARLAPGRYQVVADVSGPDDARATDTRTVVVR